MFAHIVLYRVRPDPSDRGRRRLGQLIQSLRALPGVLDVQTGSNVGPEQYTQGYDWGFCMHFADRAARDAYLEHPEHLQVAREVEQLIDDLVVLGLDDTETR
jgi:quinol monooxygenase YgiN